MQRKVIKLKRRKQTDWSPQKVAKYTHFLNSMEAKLNTLFKSIFSVSVTALGLLIVLSTIKTSRGFFHTYLWLSAECFVMTIFTVMLTWLSMARCFEIKLDNLNTNNHIKNIALAKKHRKSIIFNNILVFASIIFFFVGVICAMEFSTDLYRDIKEQDMKELRQEIKAKKQKIEEQKQEIKKQTQENNALLKTIDTLDQKDKKLDQKKNVLLKKLDAVNQKIKELEKKLKPMPENKTKEKYDTVNI